MYFQATCLSMGMVFLASVSDGQPLVLKAVTPSSSPQDITLYENSIAGIMGKLGRFDQMQTWDLRAILYDLSSAGVAKQLPAQEATQLRRSEVVIIGTMIKSVEDRVDMSVDVSMTDQYFASYPSYEFAFSDPKDQADQKKRVLYNQSVQKKLERMKAITDQIGFRRALESLTRVSRHYLSYLYPDEQGDAEETSLLMHCGLDQATVKTLSN